MVILIAADPKPEFRQPQYSSECWRGGPDMGQYMSDSKPDTGLFAIAYIKPNEPAWCYPMHSGNIAGVSDTITVTVSLFNRNETDYIIASQQPENWFMPVLYETSADPRTALTIPDTSTLGYRFQYWDNWFNLIVPQPAAIPYSGDGNVRYSLVYRVWNLPVGMTRLMMDTTEYAPDGFRLLVRANGAVWISKPTALADTLNAFGACYWRSFWAGTSTTSLSWVDSILTYNPSSIVGYCLLARAYGGLLHTTGILTALDSVIAICERYGDPAAPDTSEMSFYEDM